MGYTPVYPESRSAPRKPTFTPPTIPTQADNYLTAPLFQPIKPTKPVGLAHWWCGAGGGPATRLADFKIYNS